MGDNGNPLDEEQIRRDLRDRLENPRPDDDDEDDEGGEETWGGMYIDGDKYDPDQELIDAADSDSPDSGRYEGALTKKWANDIAATAAEHIGEKRVREVVKEFKNEKQRDPHLLVRMLEDAVKDDAVSKAIRATTVEAVRHAEREVEARVAEANLARREQDLESRGAAKVSGARPASLRSEPEETYESMSTKYGNGEISTEEFRPWKEQHDRERGQRR